MGAIMDTIIGLPDYQATLNHAIAEDKRKRAESYVLEGFVKTDGGRAAEGFGNQRNDCTVRAIVCAFGVKYKEAFHLLMAMGRKTHKAYKFEILGDEFFERLEAKGTYRKFREAHMVGTFIIKVTGHVFALVDGKTMDIAAVKARKHVFHAWRITEEHKQKLRDFFEDETVQSKIRAFPTPCQTESEKAVGIFD